MPDYSSSTDTSAPDLVASTGVNDASSPWNGLLQTALTTGVNIGQDALTKALNLQTPVTAPSSGAPGQSGSPSPVTGLLPQPAGAPVVHQSYLPWIIGGVIAVLAVILFMRK